METMAGGSIWYCPGNRQYYHLPENGPDRLVPAKALENILEHIRNTKLPKPIV